MFGFAHNKFAAIQATLDAVSTRVMIADVNRRIIYTNNAALEFLREVGAGIRRDLSQRSVSKLLETNIDLSESLKKVLTELTWASPWVKIMRRSIASSVYAFSTFRMLEDYMAEMIGLKKTP